MKSISEVSITKPLHNYKKLTPANTKLAKTAINKSNDGAEKAALEERFVPELVATATTEPIVGEGTAPFTSFCDVATVERDAKPTDGGENLKTE